MMQRADRVPDLWLGTRSQIQLGLCCASDWESFYLHLYEGYLKNQSKSLYSKDTVKDRINLIGRGCG